MTNITVHKTCKVTGKWMLTEREAGNIVRIAKHSNCGGNIPKGVYPCSFCGAYHTTHYSQTNEQRKKSAAKKLQAYKRSQESKIRIYDYM